LVFEKNFLGAYIARRQPCRTLPRGGHLDCQVLTGLSGMSALALAPRYLNLALVATQYKVGLKLA